MVKIEDVCSGARAVYESLHERMPHTSLVTQVDTSFEQVLHTHQILHTKIVRVCKRTRLLSSLCCGGLYSWDYKRKMDSVGTVKKEHVVTNTPSFPEVGSWSGRDERCLNKVADFRLPPKRREQHWTHFPRLRDIFSPRVVSIAS